ncbi:hypothetical protein V5799_004787 [Amblyomma americanum]|uniref:ABC transporter domain-containing protein n=1 Tax=Amblyomma americanum TaxID=6943 RepID=A0AAQ4D542_AMBAM
MLYWVILTYVVPTALIEKYVPSLAGYLLASRESKLISSVTPTLGTYWVLKILTISEDLDGSAEWDLVGRRVLNLDNVTILEIWLTMVATCCIVALLVAYLSQVLPWVTGIPRPLCFPLMEYDGVIAIQNVDLEVYEGLITVILGHNGAGKTTVLNTLTGMCCPTSGTVNVCGYDVVDNTAEARANLSFCQQQDVFFADLTVSEHLAYFGALKGVERSALQARVSQTLKEVHLDDKAHCTTSVLSGGMKKRLSVAIATISKPKVVVLDEPTAGLDPETRRDIWELFLSLRRECTLLIATHDMAEADALGDRVAVMAQGTVQCCGSPAFLKKAFAGLGKLCYWLARAAMSPAPTVRFRRAGAGYQVHISRKPSVAFQLYDIMNIIKGTVPEAELRRHRQTDVTVVLHVLDCAGFENMFAQLEAQSDALGIDSIGVSVSTIQDACKLVVAKEPCEQPAEDHAHRVATTEGAGGSCGGIVVALFIKRLLCFYRSLVSPLTAWILPLLVFWALVALEGSLVPEPKRWLRRLSVRLSLADAYPGAGAFVHTDDPSRTAAQEAFLPALEAQTERLDVLADPGWQLPAMAKRDFHGYTQAYALGISVTRRTIQQGKRNMSRTARELALSVASTAALRLLTGDQRAGIFARTVIHDVNEARADQAKDADEEFTEYLNRKPPSCVEAGDGCWSPKDERSNPETGVAALSYCSIRHSPTVIVLVRDAKRRCRGFVDGCAGTVLVFAYFARKVTPRGVLLPTSAVDVLVMLVPPFSLAVSLIKVLRMDLDNKECLRARQSLGSGSSFLATYCGKALEGYARFGAVSAQCCAQANESSWRPMHPIILDVNGVGYELLIMLMEAVLLFCLLGYWDSGHHFLRPSASASSPAAPSSKLDEDVRREREEVQRLRGSKLFRERALLAENLHKCGGGKRKLSIAAALIGLPRLVFLDEPTAGVDVVAKARIFAALADIMVYSGIAVVLTSHSMEDCESVCHRIGIMSEGQLQCLGSLQRLKDRFGRGYTLVLRLTPKERSREKEVQKAIAKAFAGATLKDYTEGVFKFHLWQKLRWSEVFARVNELQRHYTFEHAFVSDCSLEEIFVDIARGLHKGAVRPALSGSQPVSPPPPKQQ